MQYKDHFNNLVEKLLKNNLNKWHKKELFFYIIDKLNAILGYYNKEVFKITNQLKELLLFSEDIILNTKFPPNITFSLNEQLSPTNITPYHLSSLLSYIISEHKNRGAFCTPYFLSKYIANKVLHYYNFKQHQDYNNNKLNIADIACGTGNLILALLYNLKQYNNENNYESSVYTSFLSYFNIDCFDLNIPSLLVTKLRLLFFNELLSNENSKNACCNNLNFQFYQGDSLNKENNNLKKNKYDIIIANPPFISYGLRNAHISKDSYHAYLRVNYKSAQYKLPIYPLFIERSLELLKNKGLLAIITPDSYLLGKYFSKIRDYILNNALIKKIAILNFEPFYNVTLGKSTILFLQKDKNALALNKSSPKIITKWANNYDELLNTDLYYEYHQNFVNNSLYRFFLYFSKKDQNIVEFWLKNKGWQLKDLVSIHTGIRSKIGQRKIVSKIKKGSTWKRGLVSGHQILAYYCDYRGDWINVDSKILWPGGFRKEVINNPKILIRQTGDRIVSCVDTNHYYHLNNVHSICPLSSKVNLFALATILNSEEFNTIYQILSIEKNRTFAQVDMDFLLELSIPKISKEEEQLLANYYKRMHERQKKVKNYSEKTLLSEILKRKVL